MEIGERVICLCLVSLVQLSVRVVGVQLKVVVVFTQHTQAEINDNTHLLEKWRSSVNKDVIPPLLIFILWLYIQYLAILKTL